MVKVRALWSGGGFVLKREMGTLGEVCMSLALSGVAMGPETAGRRRRGVVNAAAVLPDLTAPAPVAASPHRQLLSRRELAGGRVVSVGDVRDTRAHSPTATPAPNQRVREEQLCVRA